jgi:magnesium-transporting ATPase (P-type)
MTHRSVRINHYAGEGEFASNYISTTHYTLWNFLPLSLFNQFRRLANFYFLCIAVMQSLPVLSVLNPITSILPLVFVVGVSMLRDAFEDYKRYKSDTETNNQPVLLLKDG